MNGEDKTQALAVVAHEPEGSGRSLGLAPADEIIDRMWKFAERICKAKFISKQAQGDPASVFYLIATGQEMGLRWTHSVRSMFMTPDGGLGMKGDVALALLQSRGFEVEFADDGQKCTCTITRPGPNPKPVSRSFSMDDAKRIGAKYDQEQRRWTFLADKFNYKFYGEEMRQWRSLFKCARVQAADLMGGIYLPEELEEVAEQRKAEGAPIETTETVVAVSPVGIKPESPTPEPEPEPVTPLTFEERKAALVKKIGGNHETASNMVKDYFRSFLAVKRLPQDPLIYTVPLERLEAAIDARMGEFMADPIAFGAEMAGRPSQKKSASEATMRVFGWPEDVQAIAKTLMQTLGHSDANFETWLNATPAIKAMSHEDLRIFLPLFGLVRGAAWDVVQWAIEQNQTLPEAMAMLEAKVGKPWPEWTKEEAKEFIDHFGVDGSLLPF